MAKYRAIRLIGHPLGSSNWAYGVGDDVPEANVKAYGYDNPEDPWVEQVDVAEVTDGPASESAKDAVAE